MERKYSIYSIGIGKVIIFKCLTIHVEIEILQPTFQYIFIAINCEYKIWNNSLFAELTEIGHSEPKIISDQHLPILARQMALHADLASKVYQVCK